MSEIIPEVLISPLALYGYNQRMEHFLQGVAGCGRNGGGCQECEIKGIGMAGN